MRASSCAVATLASIVVLAQTLTTNTTTDATITGSATNKIISRTTTISATYANPTCDAGYVVDHCLTLTTINQEDCAADDYACHCTTYQAIDTCFDNCPSDPRQHAYAGIIAQYCALAGLPTTNTALAPSTTASATSTRQRAKATSTLDDSSSSSTPNTGAKLAKGARGVMAAVAGAMAALV